MEWKENPTTEAFRVVLLDYQRWLYQVQGIGAFQPFEPQKTQEILCGLANQTDLIDKIVEGLNGDWDTLENVPKRRELDDEE